MITLDSTKSSTVVLCSRCPGFAELAADKAEGWRIGAAHEERAHAGSYQARNADYMATRDR